MRVRSGPTVYHPCRMFSQSETPDFTLSICRINSGILLGTHISLVFRMYRLIVCFSVCVRLDPLVLLELIGIFPPPPLLLYSVSPDLVVFPTRAEDTADRGRRAS